MREPAARAVVSDDGLTIWLTAYTASGDAVPVVLLPVRAAALARELLTAAVPELGNGPAKASVTRAAVKTKPNAAANDKPQTRDELYRDLAHSLGKFPSLRKQAE